jgi:hypothetical protein
MAAVLRSTPLSRRRKSFFRRRARVVHLARRRRREIGRAGANSDESARDMGASASRLILLTRGAWDTYDLTAPIFEKRDADAPPGIRDRDDTF